MSREDDSIFTGAVPSRHQAISVCYLHDFRIHKHTRRLSIPRATVPEADAISSDPAQRAYRSQEECWANNS